jgi:ribosomal protein L7/L12
MLRSILDLGLKEAKDLVEANPNRIVVKDNLTYDEAVTLQNRISSEGMESVVVVKPINSITQE